MCVIASRLPLRLFTRESLCSSRSSIMSHHQVVQILQPGGRDQLALASVPKPEPREGEALVRNAFAGVNFIDTYHRCQVPLASEAPADCGTDHCAQ